MAARRVRQRHQVARDAALHPYRAHRFLEAQDRAGVDHALHVAPGKLARFYVGNAGPNLAIPFHVVGTVFERVYLDGDVTTWLSGVQTTSVAPGAGAIFDARFEQPGANGFVNHAFANAHKGAQGTILVGDATGRMTH